MMDPKDLFDPKNINSFIDELDIKKEQKSLLKERIPLMNLEDRKDMLLSLVKIYITQLEEEEKPEKKEK